MGVPCLDRLQSLAEELTASGGKARAVAMDVTHYDQVKKLVDTAIQARIDVMINNAGLMPSSPLDHLKIDVNVKGVLYGIAAALPYMKQQKAGHIINVSLCSRTQNSRRRRCLCGDQACRTGPI